MGAFTKSLQNISVRTKLLTGFGLVLINLRSV